MTIDGLPTSTFHTRSSKMLKTLVLSLFASTALAHYTLDYPVRFIALHW